MKNNSLIFCGILAMVWYIIINIIVPLYHPGYNAGSLTVSELSAIDASARKLWNVLCFFYSLLFILFGAGVWLSAKDERRLKVAGLVIIFDAVFGLFWPPMHSREVIAMGGATTTYALHLVWAFIHLVLMLLMI